MIRPLAHASRGRALLAAALVLGAATTLFPASATAARHHRGTVLVRLSSPRGVAVSVVLRGRHRRVLSKPASKRRRRFRLSVAAGRETVHAATTVARGEVYAARVRHRRFRVRAGRRVTVRVRYRALPVARDLKAVAISRTSVTLAWRGAGRRARLRRALGAVAPKRVHAGVPVALAKHQATDHGLAPGTEYSYALFTRVHGRWAAPVTIAVGTASSGPTASFTAPSTTTIVRAGQPFGLSADHHKVSVALPAAQPTPVLGAGFVLPISHALPGGFVGKVASISPNGRTVKLVQAALTQVFSSYRVDTAISGTTRLSAKLRRHALGATAERESACKPGGSVDVEFDPSIRWAGHFSASIIDSHVLFFTVPTGARFSLEADPTFELAQKISTTGKFSCEAPLERAVVTITADPVPISIVFEPELSASIAAKTKLGGISESATVKLSASAELGLTNHVSAGLTFTGAIKGERDTEIETSIEGALGGRLTFGPGAGTSAAGAVAGISGELDPVKLSLKPSTNAHRDDLCLTTTLGGEASAGLSAQAWVGPLSAQANWNLFSRSWDYFPPIHLPAHCTNKPARPHHPAPRPLPAGVSDIGAPASEGLQIRPHEIIYTGDGTGVFAGKPQGANSTPSRLTWTSWTSNDATATGYDWLDQCNPDCADGQELLYPVTLKFSDPGLLAHHRVFQKLTIRYTHTVPTASTRQATWTVHASDGGYFYSSTVA